jgi:4'-phosphopantetheinyl transferase
VLDPPPLAERTVHLWYADLDPGIAAVESLRPLLAPDELERAARFHFDKHRRRYRVRRGRLRRLLAAYLGRPAESLELAYGDHEKPTVASEAELPAGRRLEFNLSDSEDLAIYGVARGLEIGVDVEILRPMPDALSISESFFSAPEREALRSVPEAATAEAFFNCWTRKEAYLKAIGKGLAEPLDSFVVTLTPGEPARFLDFVKVPGEVGRWSLFHLRPTSESIAAVALRDVGWEVLECGWIE